MDIATVGGLVGGLLLMLAAVFIAGGSGQTVALAQFVDPPAALLVFGGGLCVVLASVPMREFRKLPSILRKLVFPKSANPTDLVEELVRMAGIARSDGLLALEAQAQEISNPTLALALQMAVDGTRPEVITEILKNEIEHTEAQTRVEKRMFEMMGRCGPAFGMIATLLGLILMLGNLDNPDSIGPNMALALVGTLYGAAMANMVCLPCAEKLGFRGHEEIVGKQIVLAGVLAIQSGDSPRVVEQKLRPFLAPGTQVTRKAA